jgi:hypothetical protein
VIALFCIINVPKNSSTDKRQVSKSPNFSKVVFIISWNPVNCAFISSTLDLSSSTEAAISTWYFVSRGFGAKAETRTSESALAVDLVNLGADLWETRVPHPMGKNSNPAVGDYDRDQDKKHKFGEKFRVPQIQGFGYQL